MFRGLARALALALLFGLVSRPLPAASDDIVRKDRVIAGGPDASLEVRHLVLKGTNEQIGRALAEIARERYGVRLERAEDTTRVRAQLQFLKRNDPILFDRMRGVAAAFGKSVEDVRWDFTTLGFIDLNAGCSIAHFPPSSTADGKSVVSRDYDFTTGALSFGFLAPGKLHPTARPYLLELHPDRGYASIAMVSYDLLSGVLDGMNSEGLTVTLAQDNDVYKDMEPTRTRSVGLGELQTLRLLLDTCASVEEAKRALMATKQYYQYVPVHYLIADRHGNAFVWEYSAAHNQEYVVENPGQPLFMTNFTLHTHLENGLPPSADKVRGICKRYAYLRDKLGATGNLDDPTIRRFHQNVDAQASQAADTTRPPERTFWNALYHPEDRVVRLSYYLRDEPYPGHERLVKPVRTDYLEFRLDPTGSVATNAEAVRSAAPRSSSASARTAPASAAPATPPPSTTPPAAASAPARSAPAKPEASAQGVDVVSAMEAAGATVERQGKRVVSASFVKATGIDALVPRLKELPDLEELNLGNPAVTDAHLPALQGLPKLQSLGLMGAAVGDAGIEVLKSLPALKALNLIGTKVTDGGLASLKSLTALEYLGLKATAITDAGLAHLAGLTALTNLNLADTRVGDAGLVSLAGLKRLESINLSNTGVTDAGLAALVRVTSLAGLNLTGTRVTDAGLVQLKQLPKLTKLNLTGTPVTDQGARDAKKYLPFWATVTR